MKWWKHGETVIVRNIARSDGSVTTAIPTVVIRDELDLLAVYIPNGTRFKNNWVIPPDQRVASVSSITPSAQRQYRDLAYQNNSIRLYLPGRGYSIGLTFGDQGEFISWYGNLEAPFVRTSLGIDTRDYALDIIAYPDGRWQWKDEEEFKRRLAVGLDSVEHQNRVRKAGLDFIECFEHRDWPFNQDWENWRPSKQWRCRDLPEDWAVDLGSHKLLSETIS